MLARPGRLRPHDSAAQEVQIKLAGLGRSSGQTETLRWKRIEMQIELHFAVC